MMNQPTRHVARIDRRELAEMPEAWSNRERGQYLRLLLGLKGIDPNRLYRVEYYPYRSCWLLTQGVEPSLAAAGPSAPPQTDDSFYLQSATEFRRTARLAFAAAASRSQHFAAFGCRYQLPHKAQEITPADLRKLVGGSGGEKASASFNNEGGWQTKPSKN